MLSIGLLLFAAIAALGYVLYSEALSQFNAFRDAQAQGQALTLANGSLDALLTKDYQILERLVASAIPAEGYAYAALVSPEGMVIVHSDHLLVGAKVEGIPELHRAVLRYGIYQDRPIKEAIYPAWVGHRHIANAHVAYYSENSNYLRQESLQNISVILILLALFLSLGISFLARRTIRPIVRLTQSLSNSDLENLRQLDPEILAKTDEVGELARTFESLRTKLHSAWQAARETGKKLQESVDALFTEKERLQVTFASIGEGIITTNLDCAIEYMNPVAQQLTGVSIEQAHNRPLQEVLMLIDELTRSQAIEPLIASIKNRSPALFNDPMVLVCSDSHEFNVEISAAPIRASNLSVIGSVIIFRDVSQQRLLSRRLSYQATHDALTGLANRFEFEQRLKNMLAETRDGREHSLCYLDLDQFKIINDTCGHEAGDRLLQELAEVIGKHIRHVRDTLARLGGDEFAILLEDCDTQSALRVANAICEEVRGFRFVFNDHIFSLGVSIGVVNITSGIDTPTHALRSADTACYAAKNAGRDRVHLYQTDDQETNKIHGEMLWISRITEALEHNRLALAYQTIAPIKTEYTPLQYYEVLVRLVEKNGELLAPGHFLPAAERYGIAPNIDRWVIRNMCEWLGKQPSHLRQLKRCSINLSAQSLSDEMTGDIIESSLKKFNIPAEKICFEITETVAIANFTSAIALIRRLKTMGCRIALDDFGSGMSSFSYLKNLPIDYLKIDGIFIKDIHTDPVSLAMVKSIIEVAHLMGLKTIAEFVSSPEILDKLQEIGVDYGQGYAIAKPQLFEVVPAHTAICHAEVKQLKHAR